MVGSNAEGVPVTTSLEAKIAELEGTLAATLADLETAKDLIAGGNDALEMIGYWASRSVEEDHQIASNFTAKGIVVCFQVSARPLRFGRRLIRIEEISHLTSSTNNSHYTVIHVPGQPETYIRDSLKSIAEHFSEKFILIYRDMLVPRHQLGQMTKQKGRERKFYVTLRHIEGLHRVSPLRRKAVADAVHLNNWQHQHR